ncbi:SLC13 family permease [Echinicola vietnamensis]|uniref:Anion transporter n=1 Tax=Echinicola vietnamensis (strain DSM 17526 / LMG 23754 / KMM 6221) TaxID=926556 RepID=L0G2E0_ECHVK|nr:DASS family sodium-coupled anion symporter [Echinicola vietnamensis]AGA80394.1 anion transporter [Echinicola vietnamensis DSM 17526]
MGKTFSKKWSLILGPMVFIGLILLDPPSGMSEEALKVLAVTLWMAIWWIAEAVPIAVTALLPIVLFPITGAVEIGITTEAYGHKYIFLYMGGFILALAIERWGLHQRIALIIISLIGSNMNSIMLGFMLATAFLSMWISNTATAVMMLPIGMAIVNQFAKVSDIYPDNREKEVGKALMLAIAYSASIGGFATLIGTPPNLVLAGIIEELYDVKLSFLDWMKFGFPLSMLLLIICWKYLTTYAFDCKKVDFPGGKQEINKMLKALGKISFEEKWVLIIFALTAAAWILRSFIQRLLPGIDDAVIALMAAITLFVLPSKSGKRKLINWEEAVKLPWGIILLFGGGMALAKGFGITGLAEWIAGKMGQMNGMSMILMILILVAMVNFLTEITSNLATTAMILPVLAPLAMSFNAHPFMLMVPVTVAASCAFMLPVATPPNAVVFGSGYLKIPDMVKAGFWMNIFSILLVTIVSYYLLDAFWNFEADVFSKVLIT